VIGIGRAASRWHVSLPLPPDFVTHLVSVAATEGSDTFNGLSLATRYGTLAVVEPSDTATGVAFHCWFAAMDADETGTDTFRAYSLARTGNATVAIAATNLATLTRAGVMTSNVVIGASATAGRMYMGTESCGVAIVAAAVAQSALSTSCTSGLLIQSFMGVEHCHLDERLVRVHAAETGVDSM
jgi:hypothetical protein